MSTGTVVLVFLLFANAVYPWSDNGYQHYNYGYYNPYYNAYPSVKPQTYTYDPNVYQTYYPSPPYYPAHSDYYANPYSNQPSFPSYPYYPSPSYPVQQPASTYPAQQPESRLTASIQEVQGPKPTSKPGPIDWPTGRPKTTSSSFIWPTGRPTRPPSIPIWPTSQTAVSTTTRLLWPTRKGNTVQPSTDRRWPIGSPKTIKSPTISDWPTGSATKETSLVIRKWPTGPPITTGVKALRTTWPTKAPASNQTVLPVMTTRTRWPTGPSKAKPTFALAPSRNTRIKPTAHLGRPEAPKAKTPVNPGPEIKQADEGHYPDQNPIGPSVTQANPKSINPLSGRKKNPKKHYKPKTIIPETIAHENPLDAIHSEDAETIQVAPTYIVPHHIFTQATRNLINRPPPSPITTTTAAATTTTSTTTTPKPKVTTPEAKPSPPTSAYTLSSQAPARGPEDISIPVTLSTTTFASTKCKKLCLDGSGNRFCCEKGTGRCPPRPKSCYVPISDPISRNRSKGQCVVDTQCAENFKCCLDYCEDEYYCTRVEFVI